VAPDREPRLPGDRPRYIHIYSVAFSPDGKRLADFDAGRGDRCIRVWDISSGTARTLKTPGDAIYGDTDSGVAFTHDGRGIVCKSYSSHDLVVLGAQTGTIQQRFGQFAFGIAMAAFMANAAESDLVGCPAGTSAVALWEGATGRMVRSFGVEGMYLRSLALSADGRLFAVSDEKELATKIWEAQTGSLVSALPSRYYRQELVAWSPDGARLAVASRRGIPIWDMKTGRLERVLTGFTGSVQSLSFSPDSNRIAAAGGEFERSGELRVWDLASGRTVWSVSGDYVVWNATYLPNTDLIADTTERGTFFYDSNSGSLQRSLPRRSLRALSAQGSRWIGISGDAVVSLDLATGSTKTMRQGEASLYDSVAYSPDLKTIACGFYRNSEYKPAQDGKIRLYDATTGKLRQTLAGHDSNVRWLAFSPDGSTLASSGEFRPSGKVWNVASGKLLLTVPKGYFAISPAAFSPDGKSIAVVDGCEVSVWDIGARKLRARLVIVPPAERLKAPEDWIAFTPAGYYECSPGAEESIRWQVGDKLYPEETYKSQLNREDLVEKAVSSR
jgi:WD40 repeat protein